MNIQIRDYIEADSTYIVSAMHTFQMYLHGVDTLNYLLPPGNDYGERYTADMMNKVKENKGKIYIACEGEKQIGFVAGIMEEQTEDDRLNNGAMVSGRIIELFVEEEYRGKGVGKLLMEKIEQYLKEQGSTHLFVEVFAPNKDTYEIYKKFGYKDISIDMYKSLKS